MTKECAKRETDSFASHDSFDTLNSMSLAVEIQDSSRQRQKELGQFLTPPAVAEFMASMFGPLPRKVRLLDAGAGAGALTRAFVSRVCKRVDNVQEIEAILYELDPLIQASLLRTMEACQYSCASAGIRFIFTIHRRDFIHDTSAQLEESLFAENPKLFDAAIANPPYRKIGLDSPERRSLRSVGVETVNLYAGFIALIQRFLKPGGQVVAITPRSFCNGPYFRPFREDLLKNLELQRLHVFEARDAAFRNDTVLQENIVFHAIKGPQQPSKLVVSSSSGEHGDKVTQECIPFVEVVHEGDEEKFIHIPSSACHTTAKKAMAGLDTSLAALGLAVSTGPVVDFRLKHALRAETVKGTVPLLYPHHFNGGTVHWPKRHPRKPNSILDNEETRPWLVRSGIYLLTKRFTSKEERRRLVACILDPKEIRAGHIGLENHLNYFHATGNGLDRDLAYGLFAFLNSTVVDQYFRRFSGHTQVNATDLRNLAYPKRKTLQAMGSEIERADQTQEEIDQLVEKHLHGQK